MKLKYTTQKSANRHPKKVNFSEKERTPVSVRRANEVFSSDSASYDKRMEEKKRKAEYRSNPNYLK